MKKNRAIVIVDRGWIFAGDVKQGKGRITLSRAIHVRSWSSIGFDGMIAAPKSTQVNLRSVPDVTIPDNAEIFRVPVPDDWGL